MGFAVGVLPLLVLGVIVWGVVAIFRQRAREAFTLATAGAWYAHVMVLIGVGMVLSGIASLVRSLFAYVDIAMAYQTRFVPPPGAPIESVRQPTQQYLEQTRAQDLVLGITVLLVGLAVLGIHVFVVRYMERRPGGAPEWLSKGSLVMLTAFTGLVGLITAAIAVYQVVSYVLITPSAQPSTPFAEMLGIAVTFVPVWAYGLTRLMRATSDGRTTAPTTTAMAAH